MSAFQWMSAVFASMLIIFCGCISSRQKMVLQSPDGKVSVTFELKTFGEKKSVPSYSVMYRQSHILSDCQLGIRFKEHGAFQSHMRIIKVDHAEKDETYPVLGGKTSEARNHYREMTVSLQDSAQHRMDVVFRVFDDGVAFRYILPEQDGMDQFDIIEELSAFTLVNDAKAFYLGFPEYENSHENDYHTRKLSEIQPGFLHIDLPILLECPDNIWVAITEAQLIDYAGMFLSKSEGLTLRSDLTPRLDNPEIKVRGSAPHRSPWRVLMIGDSPGTLIESNIVMNLNDPCALEDISWIKPGKSTWHWWNGTVAKDVPFKPGLNTATMKHYIDFAAEHKIDYHALVDQSGQGWYGKSRGDVSKNDMTTAIPDIDLPEVLSYAKKQGVGIRVWCHWSNIKRQMKEAFPLYESWGINGFMMDFIDRSDQEMVNFCYEVLKYAAKHHMTIQFHGAYKPTGIRRTYPNMMNKEGVLNLEYLKWSNRCTPEHNLIVPFTRMLAGPMDYHLGGFRSVTKAEFESRKENMIAPVVMGTRCHHLAMYVVYENPLAMVCDYPKAYENQTGFEFILEVPTAWDETRVLLAEVGGTITIAKRKGADWYVGSMTDWTGRQIKIPLAFLSDGKYTAGIYSDTPDSGKHPNHLNYTERLVDSGEIVTADLAPGGGHVMKLSPAKED